MILKFLQTIDLLNTSTDFRVPINFSKLYCEKFLQNFTSFIFTQMCTMVGPEGQKTLKFCTL